MKKILFIVLDGAGDRPIKELDGKTALDYAKTPELNGLAKNGQTGMLEVIKGIAPESDAAVMTLLGYDHNKYYTGRGPLEALGLGIDFKDGDLALRCNFATSDGGIKLIDRRANREVTNKDGKIVEKIINNELELDQGSFHFQAGLQHRCVLVLCTDEKLSNKITNPDPAYEIKDGVPHAMKEFDMEVKKAEALEKGAGLSAKMVNEFVGKSFEVLKDQEFNKKRVEEGKLPINIIVPRDAGNHIPKLPKLKGNWAILADMPLEIGISRLVGMSVVELPLPTYTKEDHNIRVEKTLQSVKKFDNLYIHLKGPDLFGHDGDVKGKVKNIEEIDEYFFKPLFRKINKDDFLIAVTSDHCTPCERKAHSADPVPLLIYGAGRDNTEGFGERECGRGSLGLMKGKDLMNKVLELAGY